MKLLKALAAVAALSPSVTLACSFDLDCDIGSVCLKEPGKLYGYCVGGLNPGNDNDRGRRPAPDLFDLDKTNGETCTFTLDCGIGSVCLKSPGAIEGVCLRR